MVSLCLVCMEVEIEIMARCKKGVAGLCYSKFNS